MLQTIQGYTDGKLTRIKTHFVIIKCIFNPKNRNKTAYFGLEIKERGKMLYSYLTIENLFSRNIVQNNINELGLANTKQISANILSFKNNICLDVRILNKFYTSVDHRPTGVKIKKYMKIE